MFILYVLKDLEALGINELEVPWTFAKPRTLEPQIKAGLYALVKVR